VDVTPFVNVPQPESQSMEATGGVTSSASIAIPTLNLVQKGSGLFSYNTSTGVYTVLKKMQIGASFTFRASSATNTLGVFRVNSGDKSAGSTPNTTGTYETINYDGELNVGDTFDFYMYTATDNTRVFISATALSDQILTAPETFSTDTASLTYAGSASYTLSTLQNAPVGTFITFTYAANTNTRTQTTTRPTQTDADMNTNGILLYTRAYNADSYAAQPAAIAIQIGKGLKGKSLDLYKSVGKVTIGSVDYYNLGSTGAFAEGLRVKDYNEVTGILILDAGMQPLTITGGATFNFSDNTSQTSGYLVINASKNPALTGLGLNRVAARGVNSAGTSYNGTPSALVFDSAKTYDTHGALNTGTGVFTTPISGYYQVSSRVLFAAAVYVINHSIALALIKNGVTVALSRSPAQTTGAIFMESIISDVVYLNKGDTLSVNVVNERGTTALQNSAVYNYLSIIKVGN
jgi:hypothetical protein